MRNYFILSGLYTYKNVNLKLINVSRDYINSDYIINTVAGNFPNCIWNGDYLVMDNNQLLMKDINIILNQYLQKDYAILLNCTNTSLQEQDNDNIFGNLLVQQMLNNNFSNGCIINSESLYQHLVNNYPLEKIIIGKNNNIDPSNPPLLENCSYILHPKYNNNFEYLKTIPNKKNVIILLNSYCNPTCTNYDMCMFKENQAQYDYDPTQAKINNCFLLKKATHNHTYNTFVTTDLIQKYNECGINHFIFDEAPTREQLINDYIYYLIRTEHQDQIKLFLANEDIIL